MDPSFACTEGMGPPARKVAATSVGHFDPTFVVAAEAFAFVASVVAFATHSLAMADYFAKQVVGSKKKQYSDLLMFDYQPVAVPM